MGVTGNEAWVRISKAGEDLEWHAFADGDASEDVVDALCMGEESSLGLVVMFCEVGKFQHGEKFALVGDGLEVEDELRQHEEAVVVVASIIGEEMLEICRKNPKEFRAKMSALFICNLYLYRELWSPRHSCRRTCVI